MGKGGYTGGSTVISRASGWFGKPKSSEERRAERDENRARVASPVFKARQKELAEIDRAEKALRKTVKSSAPANLKGVTTRKQRKKLNKVEAAAAGQPAGLASETVRVVEVQTEPQRARKPILRLTDRQA